MLLEKVTGLEFKFSNLEDKVNNIEKKMATKEDVADIPHMKVAIFETEKVRRIEAIQDKHEATLDLLSRRSIDQEAEMKRIK